MKRILTSVLVWLGLSFSALAQAPPPVPALPDSARLTSYSIVSSTCACSVGFQIYGSGTDVDEWIQVYVNGAIKLSNDPTFGWSLSSVSTGGLTGPRPITNAILTFNAAQTGTILIVGNERPRRLSQFSENRGVAARDLNQAITDSVAVQRELWDKLNRAIIGQPGDIFNPLPPVSARANLLLGFDSLGAPVAVAGSNTLSTNQLNTWTALQTFNGGIACNITTALVPCFSTSQIATGGTTAIPVNLNQIVVQEGITAGANFVDAIALIHNITGGNGGRQSFQIATTIFSAGWLATGGNQNFVSFEASIASSGNAGGTNTANPAGAMFAYNPECFLKSGATFWAQLTCQETDVSVATGASVAYLAAMSIVQQTTHAVQGFRQDAALVFTNFPGAAGWQCLICAGSFGAAESPFGQVSPNGATYIGLFAPGGGHAAPFFKFGVDFVLANPTGTDLSGGFPFRSGVAGVTNHSVDWSGNMIGATLALGSTSPAVSGTVSIKGSTSGTITAQPQAAAGTYNWNWPTTAGSANQPLLSQGGGAAAMTFSGISYPASAISGGVAYFSSTTAMASSALLGANCIVVGGGAGVAPATSTSNCPTVSAAGAVVINSTLNVNGGGAGSGTIQLLSGAAGTFTLMGIGRTATEFAFGVAGGASQFFTGTAAGDSVVYSPTGNQFLGTVGAATVVKITTSNVLAATFDATQGMTLVGLLTLPNLSTDTAATTTRTVCQNVTGTGTANALYFGSGAAGICKGTSARFMKQDIEPIMYGIREVMQTDVHAFHWRPGFAHDGDLEKQQVGFMADEIASSMPLFATKDQNGIAMSVDYMGAMLVLFRSVQQIVETCDATVNDNFCVELKRKLAR